MCLCGIQTRVGTSGSGARERGIGLDGNTALSGLRYKDEVPSHMPDSQFNAYSPFNMSVNRQVVNSAQAPPPRPFYNQAVIANGFVFCSGQLPKDSTGKIVEGTVQDRAVNI